VLVAAMEEAQVKRLICVTGFGAVDSRGRGGLLYSVAFHLLVGRIYDRGTGLYGTWLPLFRLSRSSSRLSCGGLVVRRRDSINGQFAARRTELLESPAYRTLSPRGYRLSEAAAALNAAGVLSPVYCVGFDAKIEYPKGWRKV
jgi:hypothetical protein